MNRFPHTLIRASAGSGKTFALSNRFLELLFAGVAPDSILATTFTRKAAGEIFDRILLRLAGAATNAIEATDLAKAISLDAKSSAKSRDLKEVRERSKELLVSLLGQLHRLQIGTLDSVFLKMAGAFSFELGLPPGWRIGEDQDDALLREESVERMLNRHDERDLSALFHLLTKGIADRSIHQLSLDAVGDLYDVFREAPADAWEKFPRANLPDVESIRQLCEQALAHDLSAIRASANDALAQDVERLLTDDWIHFLASGLSGKIAGGETTYYKKPLPPTLCEILEQLVSYARGRILRQLAEQTLATRKLLEHFENEYRTLRGERGTLRFDEITRTLAAHGQLHPDEFAYRLDRRADHLLLDEFQDTSLAQWQILRPLAMRITQSVAKPKRGEASPVQPSLFCVGDVKQAIYGWRGGLPEIFSALERDLSDIHPLTLATSYRSSPVIMACVNQVFGNLPHHDNLSDVHDVLVDWAREFPKHETAKKELAGYVSLRSSPDLGDGNDKAVKQDRFYRYVADQIAAQAAAAPGKSIGVLVLKNEIVARLIYLLRDANVQASEEGGNPLTDSASVQLLLSLLKIADHPGDSASWFHVATSPLAAPLELDPASGRSVVARSAAGWRRQLLDAGYGPTIEGWARLLAAACNRREASRLQQLVELAYEFDAHSTLRTRDFLRLVESRRVGDAVPAQVRVMTVHQSKGLEFDIVFLPQLAETIGQPPTFVASRGGPTAPINFVARYVNAEVQSQLPDPLPRLYREAALRRTRDWLCVLYVALTRAVHAMHLIVPSAPKQAKFPKSHAGLLLATLTEASAVPPQTTLFESGDADWFAKSTQAGDQPRTARRATPSAVTAGPPATIRLANSSQNRHTNLEPTSPSRFEGGSQLPIANLFADATPSSFAFGTLIHKWCEQIEWLDQGPPSDEELCHIAHGIRLEIGDLADRLDKPLAYFKMALQQPAIAGQLSRRACENAFAPTKVQLEVFRERTFAYRDGEQLISGTIDRLVLVRADGKLVAANVIDFKTDAAITADEVTARIDFYRPQLEAYRQAVARLWRLKPKAVKATLVMLASGAVANI